MDTLHQDSLTLRRWGVGAACILITTALAGCGGGDDNSSPAPTYTIGGTISGLTTVGLVLENGSDTLSPAANAATFTFATKLTSGATYAVTVETQPLGLSCQVSNGSGTVPNAAVTNVNVTCSANEWTWVGGPSTAGGLGVYGTQGTAAAANLPGARDAAMGWVDSAGNFWLFGGYGDDSAGTASQLNDLWEY
jgi:hypothetical protein